MMNDIPYPSVLSPCLFIHPCLRHGAFLPCRNRSGKGEKRMAEKKSGNAANKERIENRLIEMIESSGIAPWKCPWIFGGTDTAFRGSDYSGINSVLTAMARTVMGRKSRVWLTHSKIEELNGKTYDREKKRWTKTPDAKFTVHIRKGAKGLPVVFWNWIQKKDDEGNPVLDEFGNPVEIPFLRTYTIFNAEDIEGFDPAPFEPPLPDTGINVPSCAEIESRLLSLYVNHPKVVHGGDRACYIPDLDQVSLPDPAQFTDVTEYASTLAHELAHSTGHESRLHRKFGVMGDKTYSREELVAEFASAMILEDLGIHELPAVENSAAYLKSWLSHIRETPGVLFDAITDARKAAAMVLGKTTVADTRLSA